MQGLHLNDIKN